MGSWAWPLPRHPLAACLRAGGHRRRASASGLVGDHRPRTDRAREALHTIRAAARQALEGLHDTVATLREGTDPPVRRPGLAWLEELTGLAGGAGVQVQLAVLGSPRPLPPAVDQAGYRLVQETLANVLHHAEAATVKVRLVYGEDDLTVQVDGDGRSPAAGRPPERVGLLRPASRERHLWQTTLSVRAAVALCLVELRGFEPLTPCMPCHPHPFTRPSAASLRNASALLRKPAGQGAVA
jgi:hypothetical protein